MNYSNRLNVCIILLSLLIVIMIGVTVYKMIALETIDYPEDKLVKENIEIYFMPSETGLGRFFEVINESEETISCVFRSLNYPLLENALIEQENKGVKVRILVNPDYRGNKRIYLPYLRFADEHEDFMMHSTYCVLDSKIVVTGSMLFNENTMDYNFHDLVIINSEEISERFNKNFWILYENQTKEKNLGVEEFYVDDTEVNVYFCPIDNCTKVYVDLINLAKTNISFAIYAFTNPEITEAIIMAEERGVTIRGIVEMQGLTPSSILYQGIEGVKKDVFNRRVHTKLLVIDEEISITGSLNPSIRGVESNDEVVLVLKDEEIAKFYLDYIDYIWSYQKDI